MNDDRCWCGRWWVVEVLRKQCENGDHLPPKQP